MVEQAMLLRGLELWLFPMVIRENRNLLNLGMINSQKPVSFDMDAMHSQILPSSSSSSGTPRLPFEIRDIASLRLCCVPLLLVEKADVLALSAAKSMT